MTLYVCKRNSVAGLVENFKLKKICIFSFCFYIYAVETHLNGRNFFFLQLGTFFMNTFFVFHFPIASTVCRRNSLARLVYFFQN